MNPSTLAVAPGGSTPGMLLGTVTTSTVTYCGVTLDGATSEVTAVVPDDLKGRIVAGVAGARVLGVRIGSKFYVTDTLSSTGVVDTNYIWSGAFNSFTENALGSFTWPAGAITVNLSLTGYSTVGGAVGTTVLWIDHSAVVSRPFFFNTANEHTNLPPVLWRQGITGGAHTIGFTGLVTSDANDNAWATVHWSPT